MMRGLENKRALITGGASGIGKATAMRFLEERVKVAILDRDETACDQIQEELAGLAAVIVADVSDSEAVKRAFSDLDDLWGGLDVLINNAGISMRHKFLDITPEEWRQVIDVNLNGMFFVAQAAARRQADASRRIRRDHQHGVHQRLAGLSVLRRLQRLKGGGDRIDPLYGAGAGS
jgi:NAD(P)-dependent dehydrogenase (short-subunit alcohol dehydrogenase family)